MAKHDYITREGKYARESGEVEHVEHGHLPEWAADNARGYWQAADQGERANGRLFVEVQVALPVELDRSQQRDLARAFAERLTDGESLPYTLAIHRGESKEPGKPDNPHAHIVVSERSNDGRERTAETWFRRANPQAPERGGARKVSHLRAREWPERIRQGWAGECNRALERAGRSERIDPRTLAEQARAAFASGDLEQAAELSRAPEPKRGAGDAIQRRYEQGKAPEPSRSVAACERVRAANDEWRRQCRERSQKAERARAAHAAAEQLVPVSQEERAVGQAVGKAIGKRRVQAKRVVELTKESPKIERQRQVRHGGVKRREFADGRTYREATGVSLKRLHERQAWEQTKPLRDKQREDLDQQHRQEWIKLYERQEGEISWLDKHSRTEEGRKEMAEEAAKQTKAHGEEVGPDDVLQDCKKELEEVHRGRREELGMQQGQELETLGKQQQIDYQNALQDPLRKETLMKAKMAVNADVARQENASGGRGFGGPDGDFNLESVTQEYGIEIEESWKRERERERIGPGW